MTDADYHLRAKIRAAAYLDNQTDFRTLLQQFDGADGTGGLRWDDFYHIMRHEGGMNPKLCSDDDLRDMFEAIDSDRNGIIDANEFAIWSGLSRSQRFALPNLKTSPKSKPSAENADAAGPPMDIVESLTRTNEDGLGLSKFWYKQRAAYDRCVRIGEEYRILLPYNVSNDDIKKRYRDIHAE